MRRGPDGSGKMHENRKHRCRMITLVAVRVGIASQTASKHARSGLLRALTGSIRDRASSRAPSPPGLLEIQGQLPARAGKCPNPRFSAHHPSSVHPSILSHNISYPHCPLPLLRPPIPAYKLNLPFHLPAPDAAFTTIDPFISCSVVATPSRPCSSTAPSPRRAQFGPPLSSAVHFGGLAPDYATFPGSVFRPFPCLHYSSVRSFVGLPSFVIP